jgi:hypothetical protein
VAVVVAAVLAVLAVPEVAEAEAAEAAEAEAAAGDVGYRREGNCWTMSLPASRALVNGSNKRTVEQRVIAAGWNGFKPVITGDNGAIHAVAFRCSST